MFPPSHFCWTSNRTAMGWDDSHNPPDKKQWVGQQSLPMNLRAEQEALWSSVIVFTMIASLRVSLCVRQIVLYLHWARYQCTYSPFTRLPEHSFLPTLKSCSVLFPLCHITYKDMTQRLALLSSYVATSPWHLDKWFFIALGNCLTFQAILEPYSAIAPQSLTLHIHLSYFLGVGTKHVISLLIGTR